MSLEGLCVGWRWRRLDLSGNNCAWQGGTDHVDKIPREPRGAFIHGLHGDHEHRSTGTVQGSHGPKPGLGQFLPLGGDEPPPFVAPVKALAAAPLPVLVAA